MAETAFVSTDPISSAPQASRDESWDSLARLCPAPSAPAAPLEAPGFRRSVQRRKVVLQGPFLSLLSPLCSGVSSSCSPGQQVPLHCPAFNCLYRPFQACPALIFPGSECNATNLSKFPHHTPLHALFFPFFFSLFIDLEKSCNVNTNNPDSHVRESKLCALYIFCR